MEMPLLSTEQICAYLARLQLSDMVDVDLLTLNRLLFAHLTQVPFDSLDVWATGLCPSLDTEDLYEKIVVKRRGGYCFEQNTLFRILLNSLGFTAYQVVACLLNADGTPQPPEHNVIICSVAGKKYLVDVGYGGSVPFEALELVPGQYGKFTLKCDSGLYILERMDKNGIRPFLQFKDIPAAMTDLISLNCYVSQDPDSHFRHIIHVNQRRPDGGTYVIEGNEFRIYKEGHVMVREIVDIEDLKQILGTYYGIDPCNCILRDKL